MSPMWLDEQAEFFETPSAVVAGGIAFGPGATSKSKLFKARMVTGSGPFSYDFPFKGFSGGSRESQR